MVPYLQLLNHILDCGVDKEDRTGTGTKSVFGYQMRFDLQQGFPLLTTKKLHTRAIIHELLWFLRGDTNIKYLQNNDVHIWDEWADEHGDLGPVYGHQWRSWPGPISQSVGKDDAWSALEMGLSPGEPVKIGFPYYDAAVRQEPIDQITNVIERIKAKPDDRRLIVSAWNPAEVDEMALPPCHCLFQFYTRPLPMLVRVNMSDKNAEIRGTSTFGQALSHNADAMARVHQFLDELGVPRRALDCQLYQRSCDTFLGVPFNIASYALLTSMVAQVCGMVPGHFVWTGGDVHLYRNHLEQAQLQLAREPRALPKLVLNPEVKDIFDFKFEDIQIQDYNPHPHIAAPVSV